MNSRRRNGRNGKENNQIYMTVLDYATVIVIVILSFSEGSGLEWQ
jgi:hypothetical protein